MGRVLGKAVGERCVVDMALERTLLCHLLRRRVTLHDMRVGGGGAVDDDQVMGHDDDAKQSCTAAGCERPEAGRYPGAQGSEQLSSAGRRLAT